VQGAIAPAGGKIFSGRGKRMAKYEHLPIYKRAFELNLYIEKIVRHFSRYHKYTLGTELRDTARKTVKLIIRANNSRDKLNILIELRELLEELKLTIRLCKEVRAFNNFNSFQVAINHTIDISRQNEGWIKSLSSRNSGHGLNPASS